MILPQARRESLDERDFTSERFSYGAKEPFGLYYATCGTPCPQPVDRGLVEAHLVSIMQHAEHHAATDSTQFERT